MVRKIYEYSESNMIPSSVVADIACIRHASAQCSSSSAEMEEVDTWPQVGSYESNEIILESITTTLYSTEQALAYLALRIASQLKMEFPAGWTKGTSEPSSNCELNRFRCTIALPVHEMDSVFDSRKFT